MVVITGSVQFDQSPWRWSVKTMWRGTEKRREIETKKKKQNSGISPLLPWTISESAKTMLLLRLLFRLEWDMLVQSTFFIQKQIHSAHMQLPVHYIFSFLSSTRSRLCLRRRRISVDSHSVGVWKEEDLKPSRTQVNGKNLNLNSASAAAAASSLSSSCLFFFCRLFSCLLILFNCSFFSIRCKST